MPLIGGAVMPHGALILDPARAEMAGEVGDGARRLHAACVEAGRLIEAAESDLILLYTPHGLLGEGADMWVYLNGSASGSCEWMGSWAEHRVSVQCDAEAARSLVQHLKAGGHSAAGLTAFSGYDAPLRWGEAVPLCFLGGATATKAKVVVLSHGPASTGERAALAPQRRAQTEAMGRAVAAWAEADARRVLLLISGDLAHVHGNERAPAKEDGTPDPRYLNPKYPQPHASAVPFEAAVAAWAGSGDAAHLEPAWALVREAMCCGLEGFALLDAALKATGGAGGGGAGGAGGGAGGGGGGAWQARLLAHEAPVYYVLREAPTTEANHTSAEPAAHALHASPCTRRQGMLVATFLPSPAAAADDDAAPPPCKQPRTASSSSTTAAAPAAPAAAAGALLPALPRAARLDCAGQTVLVSGAGHGFGRAIALAFAALGELLDALGEPSPSPPARSSTVAPCSHLARRGGRGVRRTWRRGGGGGGGDGGAGARRARHGPRGDGRLQRRVTGTRVGGRPAAH